MCNCRDLKAELDSPEVDPLQIARRITSKPSRRCAHCYAAAGSRAKAQFVNRVTTSCGSCKKPYCLRHMYLVCQQCHNMRTAASPPVLLSQLEQISEEQQQQISDLTKQVEKLHAELSRKAAARGLAYLPFSCSQCTQSFAQFVDLKSHSKVHSDYTCSYCCKSFSGTYQLKIHLRSHTGEKPFSCSQCERTFSEKNNMKQHMKVHTGEKPYFCEKCGKSFALPRTLRVHLKVHTRERSYSCCHCKQLFASASALKDHMRSHAGKQLYTCAWCSKTFLVPGSFEKHMKVHKGNSGYSCFKCPRTYSRPESLEFHMSNHHSENSEAACNAQVAELSTEFDG